MLKESFRHSPHPVYLSARALRVVRPPTSPEVKSTIVRYHLQSYGRNEIARFLLKAGMKGGEGTVSRVSVDFEARVRREGLEAAARDFGVSDEIRETQAIRKRAREYDLKLDEVLEAAKPAKDLKEAGVPMHAVVDYVVPVYRMAKDVPAEAVAAQCKEIDRLEKKHHLKFDDLKQEYDRLGKGVEDLGTKKSDLEDNVEKLEKVKGRLLLENRTTEDEVKNFLDDKKFLLSVGLDTRDHEAATKLLRSIESLGYRPATVVAKLKSIESLEGSIALLKGDQARLSESIETEKGDLKEVGIELAEKRKVLLEVRRLERVGVDLADVADIRKTVVAISARRSLTSRQAMERFFRDIVKNYDILLGIDSSIRKLKTDETDLGRQVKIAEEKVEVLEGQFNSRKKEWDAFVSLANRGIDSDDLVEWKAVIAEAGLDPVLVTRELVKYRSLIQSYKKVKADFDDLKERRNIAKSEINELETNKKELVASIETITGVALAQLESHQKKVGESIKETTESFADLARNLDETTRKALETGKMIGSLGTLKPAMAFLHNGAGTREEVLAVGARMVEMLRDWASRNDSSVIASSCDVLLISLRDELRKPKN